MKYVIQLIVFAMIFGGCGSSSSSGGGSYTITVRAHGTAGSENLRVTVGGTQVDNWTLSTSYQNRNITTSLTGGINVEFTNDDGTNRDVQVDYIIVDGTTRQAEDQATNTGVWQNSQCGGSYSEWLHCAGYIAFQGKGAVENSIVRNEVTEADILIYPNPAENGIFTIELGKLTGTSEVRIFDMGGKMVYQSSVADQPSLNLDLDVPNGLYIVKVINDKVSVAKRVTIK